MQEFNQRQQSRRVPVRAPRQTRLHRSKDHKQLQTWEEAYKLNCFIGWATLPVYVLSTQSVYMAKSRQLKQQCNINRMELMLTQCSSTPFELAWKLGRKERRLVYEKRLIYWGLRITLARGQSALRFREYTFSCCSTACSLRNDEWKQPLTFMIIGWTFQEKSKIHIHNQAHKIVDCFILENQETLYCTTVTECVQYTYIDVFCRLHPSLSWLKGAICHYTHAV